MTLSSCLSFAGTDGQFVRIRLFKNLNEFPAVRQGETRKINDRLWTLKGKQITFHGKKLSAQNLIVKTAQQKYDLIGQFDFDHYLAGVVASEMPTRWPTEALNTQAIVARSFALARIQERQDQIFHLDSDQMDQVFQSREDFKALAAVKSTQNIVLKNQNGEILKAFFHADCGGQTIPASKVWPGEIDSGTAVDPWCQTRKNNQWNYEISEKEFLKNLKQNASSEVAEGDFFQQKIQTVSVNHFEFSIQKLRQIFGFSKIKNSPESMQVQDGKITLSGGGYGHGVGLCQWGTFEQAKRGFSSIQILKHYYPRAEIALNALPLAQLKIVSQKLVSR